MQQEHELEHESAESHREIAAASQLSCVQCRSQKLKCDRHRPVCGRCLKQNETCSYPASRQRALGRRKNVRELEERIEQLEGLLRAATLKTTQNQEQNLGSETLAETLSTPLPGHELFGASSLPLQQDLVFGQPPLIDPGTATFPEPPANQLIDLGLFEQLPSFDLIDELTAIFFQNVHEGAPMIHRANYTAAVRLPPHMRPPMCLQYIVMASAAVSTDTYRHLAEPFYRRARVYAEADELKGQGETFTTVGHAQCWCLVSAFECHVYANFTRASTSLCRGLRIAQMLKLHQLDDQNDGALHSGLPPARNPIEAEERRRTWWVVFLADRYLSSSTGWPSMIDERYIQTMLPSSEGSFAAGVEEPAFPLSRGLQELREGQGARISPFAIRILAANELLRTLDHSSRPFAHEGAEDFQNGPYWRRQRDIDRNLNTLSVFLPENLHVSQNTRSLDAILVHTCTNMATIQLHRTALGLMYQHSMPSYLIAQSQERLVIAAEGIITMFRAVGEGVGAAIRNPLLSFAAYMAASVFLDDFQAAGATVDRGRQSEQNLNFLAQLLVFHGRSRPFVRTMAFQLATDMKRTGYDSSMMDKVMSQLATSGGSTSEILKSGSKALPMFFCPAITSAPVSFSGDTATDQTSHGSATVSHGVFGFQEAGVDMAIPPHGYMMGSTAGGASGGPSMMQAGSSDGLSSQLSTNSGNFFLQ